MKPIQLFSRMALYLDWIGRPSGICQWRWNSVFDEAYIWFCAGIPFLYHSLFVFSTKKKSDKSERLFSNRSYRIVSVLLDW